MVYCFLADGFEELEAVAPIDILRRADVKVLTVGVTGKTVRGSHGITVTADITVDEVKLESDLEAVILPGGLPGAVNLENSSVVQNSIDFAYKNDAYICAICAAPQIIGHKGLLKCKEAIAYPGFEKELAGAKISDSFVVVDDRFITAKGAGVAVEFGLAIVSALKSQSASDKIRAAIQMK